MKAVEIKAQVLRIDPNGTIVLVPVVKHEKVYRNKETGRKLTDKQLEKIDKSLVDEKRVLVENTNFWNENPSANIRLMPDKDHGFEVGQAYVITITKAK